MTNEQQPASEAVAAAYLLDQYDDEASTARDMAEQAAMRRPLLQLLGGGTGIRDLVNPERILADVAGKRAIVELMTSMKHAVVEGDSWYTCAAATEARDGGETCNDNRRGEECDCGRDAQVMGVLRQLLHPYAGRADFDPTWRTT